ncbi:MAG: MFS transporter, partial [Acidimicrobiales bacterium]
MGDGAATARNLRLIPVHQGLAGALVWIPVMVLFTRARFDLDGALLLASMYYLFVVLLEVPSGWMSDRFGRVVTLRLAALSWVVAHSCFLIGGDVFAMVAAGQFFMAAGFASLSGTDVTFHYDTLEALGRSSEYAGRQARVSALGFVVTSLSAVTGGVVGLIDLRLAFLISLLLALAQLAVTFVLVEPPVESAGIVDGAGARRTAAPTDAERSVGGGGTNGVERTAGPTDAGPSGARGGPGPADSATAHGLGVPLLRCIGYLRDRYLG